MSANGMHGSPEQHEALARAPGDAAASGGIRPIDQVVIVGRDAALWLTACVLHDALGPAGVTVIAVELPTQLREHDVYATLPALEALHSRLRIGEAELLGRVRGCFSLGQNFKDTSRATPSFFHAYGTCGSPIDQKPFLPHWLLARSFGLQVALEDFSLTAAAAKQGRILVPDADTELYGRADYGYHLPALEYVRTMKHHASARGIASLQAHDCAVISNPVNGDIAALLLSDGHRICGEFFIDATGAEAKLMTALGVLRESWRDSFTADRVLRACAPRFSSTPPYAEIRAWGEGWLALHPTQVQTHVVQTYSSAQCSDDRAMQWAVDIAGMDLQQAAVQTSLPGRSEVGWQRNCVAVGAAAAAFDPIHSVELHALHVGLVNLLTVFPVASDFDAERVEYNRTLRQSVERIRDFQSAFYVLNRYPNSRFWCNARNVAVSVELMHKIETFRARGEVPLYENETVPLDSWQALFIGHGVMPDSPGPIVDTTSPERMKHEFRRILSFIKDKVHQQPAHDVYLQRLSVDRSRVRHSTLLDGVAGSDDPGSGGLTANGFIETMG